MTRQEVINFADAAYTMVRGFLDDGILNIVDEDVNSKVLYDWLHADSIRLVLYLDPSNDVGMDIHIYSNGQELTKLEVFLYEGTYTYTKGMKYVGAAPDAVRRYIFQNYVRILKEFINSEVFIVPADRIEMVVDIHDNSDYTIF